MKYVQFKALKLEVIFFVDKSSRVCCLYLLVNDLQKSKQNVKYCFFLLLPLTNRYIEIFRSSSSELRRAMSQQVMNNRATPYDRNGRGDRGNRMSMMGNNNMRNMRGGNNDRRGGRGM